MATKNEYTMRMFLTNVENGNVTEIEKAYAKAEIEKLDKRNADRKGKESATAKANAPIKEAIVDFVKANPKSTANVIGAALGLTTAKVTALGTQLKNAGVLVTEDVKAGSGKGKVKAYSLKE